MPPTLDEVKCSAEREQCRTRSGVAELPPALDKVRSYSIWEVGRRVDSAGRPHQEDSLFPPHGESSAADRLFMVCDGIGGHDAGEVASRTVCDTLGAEIRAGLREAGADPLGVVERAVSKTYDALDACDTGASRKMGTTLAMLLLLPQGALAAHLGDSRVYHIRPGRTEEETRILFVTEDHSLVNSLVKIGEMTPEEARTSSKRHVITKAMQPHSERLSPDIREITDIRRGDYFYLCSDGMLEQEEMDSGEALRRIFSDEVPSMEEKVDILRRATSENRDNHSAYVIRVGDEPPARTPVLPRKAASFQHKLKMKIQSMIRKFLLTAVLLMGAGGLAFPQGIITHKKAGQEQTQRRKTATATKRRKAPKIKISEPSGYISGHGYVDLGLPSGVKWATCNVGASSPSDYGNYYAWGEIRPKAEYTEENWVFYGRREEDIPNIGGNPQYDAARANWGGTWRLPTWAECEELVSECTWTAASLGEHNGCKITGKNGNSIFLPASGSIERNVKTNLYSCLCWGDGDGEVLDWGG